LPFIQTYSTGAGRGALLGRPDIEPTKSRLFLRQATLNKHSDIVTQLCCQKFLIPFYVRQVNERQRGVYMQATPPAGPIHCLA
jgi:hypothetical protein